MATAVTPSRFSDNKKVEKWFRRNCDDVFKRECTALEKGDFPTCFEQREIRSRS
jgi:hypothetical protein